MGINWLCWAYSLWLHNKIRHYILCMGKLLYIFKQNDKDWESTEGFKRGIWAKNQMFRKDETRHAIAGNQEGIVCLLKGRASCFT